MYSLDQELAFATQKVREQRAVIATLQSELAAARAELAGARKALIDMWALDPLDDVSFPEAEARYAREIAHKGEEG